MKELKCNPRERYNSNIREKGESQDATKKKDEAFANLTEWVRTCYAIAKIALKDDKQLLESLAKLVKRVMACPILRIRERYYEMKGSG